MNSADISTLDHAREDWEREVDDSDFIDSDQKYEDAYQEGLRQRDWEEKRHRFDLEASYCIPCGDFDYPFYVNIGLWWWMMGCEDMLGYSVPCYTQPISWR